MARPPLFISSREEQKHGIAHYIELAKKGERICYDSKDDTSLETLKALIDLAIEQDYIIYAFEGVEGSTIDYINKHQRPELYIDAEFYAGMSIPMDDVTESLDIKWEDVESYSMKWLTLYISMKDGRELEYDCEDYLSWESIDTKRPSSLEVRKG